VGFELAPLQPGSLSNCPSKISSNLGNEKIFGSSRKTAGLELPKSSRVNFKPITCGKGLQAVREDRFQACTRISAGGLWIGGLLGRRAHAIVENSLMRGETNREKPMRLALVGMSGSGKTFWAKKLAEKGTPAVFCDDRIEQRLAHRLGPGGYSGINGVAAWMGWPDGATYAEREAAYLAEENHTLDEVLQELAKKPDASLVLDTTGSVIYAGNHLLMRLRRQMTIVYLAATVEEQHLLIERYLNDPKPVLWRGAFQPRSGEAPRETVARCYPALIEARRRSYEALAHCTVGVGELRATRDAEQFLERVRKQIT
jgi:shikimate kinase